MTDVTWEVVDGRIRYNGREWVPGHQVLARHHQPQPHRVALERPARQAPRAGVLCPADTVLHMRVLTMDPV
ncbi:MAG: hypothetical protein ACRDYA_22710 [Egibacteraceae bacterium]